MTQRTLPNVRRLTARGNRGREWEAILERTHAWYRNLGLGVVFPISNTWDFAGFNFWKTQPDYVGSLRGRGIVFDAKEFSGASISYDNFDHDGRAKQIRDVYDASQGGNLAGYMVLEKRTMRVHWVSAEWVFRWSESIRRNVPGTVKSINFSKVVDGRIRLLGECDGYRFDYAPLLIPECRTSKGETS
jgi:penicillin-binding protein-related factor A (putative recombinase)